MKTRITLIRHGETTWNLQGRWQGFAPVPLSDVGRGQAIAAADSLKTTDITRIITSDLSRCVETAAIINRVLNVPLSYESRLREINVGFWQGLTSDEIQRWDPENFEQYRNVAYHLRAFPGGESFKQLGERAVAALHEWVEAHGGEHLLVVTHGGVIRSILFGLAGVEPGGQRVENCSLNRLIHQDGVWSSHGVSVAAASVQWD